MADELGRIVERLSPELGEPEGESRPLEGGITNRNYLVTLGGNRYVIRVPGKDTSLLGIDRSAEREANENAAAIGVAPRVVAQLDDPPCLVTEFVECTEMTPEDLRDPTRRSGCWRPFGRCTSRARISRPTSTPSAWSRSTARPRPREAARSPPPTTRPISGPARSRPLSLGRSTTRSPATTTCWPATSSAAPSGSGSSTGSTRAWGIATSTWRTSRSTTSSPGPARRAACGLLLGGGQCEEAGHAAPHALHVGFPRGDVGGGPDRRLRPRLRFQGLRRHALRADAKDRGERELRRGGSRRPGMVDGPEG